MAARPIVHIEIPARTPANTAGFYAELFGWEIEHAPDPLDYTMFKSGSLGGGIPQIGDYYKPGDVLVYIASDDIDADLERIQAAGGAVLMGRQEVPGMGWMAMFSDPDGNRLALWQPAAG